MAQMRSVGNLSRRGVLAAAAAAAAWPPAAMAQPPAAAATPPEPPGAFPEAELQERRDSALRLTTDVFVEGQGPYRFVIDTGASRSVVSDRLAEGLKLPAAAEPTLVHGLAGAAPAPTVMISRMSAGKLSIPIRSAPVLRQSDLGCDGLLGLDAFRGRRVVFDFDHRTVTILKPVYNALGVRGGARPLSEAVVRARQRYGQLTIVDAGVAGHRVTCFIDSGAQMSVGNLGLLNAIRARGRGPRDNPTTTLHGATGDDIVCQVAPVSDLRVGEIHFTDFLMAFADLHTFDLWALKKEPAIMIGMDFLNLFGRVEIDFAENLVRFQKAKRYP